jgi:tetratricopeptide (TPR) repeat protein
MRRFRIIATVLMTFCMAAAAAGQGRVRGVVQDADGRPIKGALIRAVHPDTSDREWTSTTDDKGRFVFLGMRIGTNWTFRAEAPGFSPMQGSAPVRSAFGVPLTFSLPREPGPLPGALVKDIQDQVASANVLREQGRYDQAITAYQSIQAKNPKLTSIHFVLAGVYRQQAEQERNTTARLALLERASAAYDEVLKADADNPRARAELAAVRAALTGPQ